MTLSILKYNLTIGLLISTHILFAQVKKNEQPPVEKNNKKKEQVKGVISEEVDVVRPYKPILADAVKIRRNPDLTNNPTFRPVLLYSILDKKLELDSNIPKLRTQKLVDKKEIASNNNYLKLAGGNFNTSLGQLYINNGNDEALRIGLFVKHLAQQGNIDKQQFSHQKMSAFGHSIGTRATLSGQLNFDRKQTYFYGFDPAIATAGINPPQQRFNVIKAKGELFNNYAESNRFSYKINGNGYLFNNLFDAKENNVAFSASLNQVVNRFSFGIDASIDLTNSKDLAYSINNDIFKSNPHVQLQASNFILNIGLNIVQEYRSGSRMSILPAVSVVLPIASTYASLFAGVHGDVIKNNLNDLTSENPYLNQNAAITNTTERINIYAGIKGNTGHVLGFKATASYKEVENMQLFQNNPLQINRFDVIYDPGKSTILALEGELEIKASDVFSLQGRAQANSYKMATEKEAWFKPALCLGSTVKAKISRKLSLDAEVAFNGETNAKVINPITSQQSSVTINSYTDISAGAEYQIIKNARLYVRANNLLGTSYEQYLYYPKLGFGIFGGLNFSF